MSYAAMLSPFGMPYPKKGSVQKVKKDVITGQNAPGVNQTTLYTDPETGITYEVHSGHGQENDIEGSIPTIIRGDLLCVTRNESGVIYVWPVKHKIIKKTHYLSGHFGSSGINYDYIYKEKLPVMGVAISSEDENGFLKAILIDTDPPIDVSNNIDRKYPGDQPPIVVPPGPSSDNKPDISIDFSLLQVGVEYTDSNGNKIIKNADGSIEYWENNGTYWNGIAGYWTSIQDGGSWSF